MQYAKSYVMLFPALLASTSPAAAEKGVVLNCASSQGIRSEAEVVPVRGQGVYAVNVTFIGRRPSSDKEVDRILRDCVAAAVKRDGTKDILGSAWLRKSARANPNDDDLIDLYGALKFLSYEARNKTIAVREINLKKKTQ